MSLRYSNMSLRYFNMSLRYSNMSLRYLFMKTSVKSPKNSQVDDKLAGIFPSFHS
jgi:hypothetical protein